MAALRVAGAGDACVPQPVNATLPAVPVGLEKFSEPINVAPPASLTCRDVVSVALARGTAVNVAGENASVAGTPQVDTVAVFGPAIVIGRA